MAESKKITELQQIPSLNNDDEFLVVDKSTTSGDDASVTGKTSKVKFSDLKTAVGSQGSAGEKGQKGEQGNSVTGPTGPAGPAGPQGDQGISIQGDPGPAGPQGDKGQKGVLGLTGPTGPQGDKGPQGNSVTGAKGPQGNSVTGAKGPQGNSITGAKGDKGPQGNSVTGPKGPQGNSVTGAKGPQGNSITGAKGQKGQTGASGVFTGGTVSGNTTYSGYSTYTQDIRFEGSQLEIGDYHVDDSILDMSCRSIDGASNHQGRIRFVPAHGQALYRVRGYIDLMTDAVSDTATPVVRIQGAYTSSSMQNAVMQENRIKLEVKGSIDAVGNISTDSRVYADGIHGNGTAGLGICSPGYDQKVIMQYEDSMYSFMRWSVAEFSNTEVRFKRNLNFDSGYSLQSSGTDASEIENVKNTELNGIETISKLKISDFTLDGKQKTGIVAQDLQSVMPNAVSLYEEEKVVKPSVGKVVYFDNEDKEVVIGENLSLDDIKNEKLPENHKFIETHSAETQKINKLAYSTDDIITALVKSVQELTDEVNLLKQKIK